MIGEVVAIGDELTSGQRLDTNSQWLSQGLGDLGVRVLHHSTVGDDLEANADVFRHAFERADIVVCTGGLGPTADDLTRQALAAAAGVELHLDEPSLRHIEKLFTKRGRDMPASNRIQAMFPDGSVPIPNPHGSAPGVDLCIDRPPISTRCFALPGVPAEMREMWEETVEPAVIKMLGEQRRVIRHRRIKCFGVGESHLEDMLPDMIRRGRRPAVGITVSRATITLRVTADGIDEQECAQTMSPTIDEIHQCLGDLVFGEEDDELQHAVLRQLDSRGQSLATAELAFGGALSGWLNEESSHAYRGGLVLHDLEAARKMLGETTSVGAPFAELLASKAREALDADYGLSIAFFAEDDPDGAWIGLSCGEETSAHRASLKMHPDIIRARTAKHALNSLRLRLLKA